MIQVFLPVFFGKDFMDKVFGKDVLPNLFLFFFETTQSFLWHASLYVINYF